MLLYKCSKCGKEYSRQGQYERHIEAGCRGRQCELCGQSFTRKDNLDRHMSTVHQEKICCSHCERPFRDIETHKSICLELQNKRGIKRRRDHTEVLADVQQPNSQVHASTQALQWIDCSNDQRQTSDGDESVPLNMQMPSFHYFVPERTEASLRQQISKAAIDSDLQLLRTGVNNLLSRGISIESIDYSSQYLNDSLTLEIAARGHTPLIDYLWETGFPPAHWQELGLEDLYNRVEAILLAAEYDRADIVSAALDEGFAVDVCNSRGDSLLCTALQTLSAKVIRLLLSRGASANGPWRGKTPLLMAVEGYQDWYYNGHGCLIILEDLLKAQADPNRGSPLPLDHAVKNQVLVAIPMLLKAGADPDLLPESTRHDLEQLRESAFLKVEGAYRSAALDLLVDLDCAIYESSSTALQVLEAIVWYDPSLKMSNPMFESNWKYCLLALAATKQRREIVRCLLQLAQEEVDPETVKFPDWSSKFERSQARKLLREMVKEKWPHSSDAT